ncbi:MAG: hypothetical protein EOP04_29020, partial [Proteobacteria bacterium]
MVRKLLITLLAALSIQSGNAQASPAFSSYINFYLGKILISDGAAYNQVELPTFTFTNEDFTQMGQLATICYSSRKCIVASSWNDQTTFFFSDQESIDNIQTSELPTLSKFHYARVDADTLVRMQGVAVYTYNWGDDAAVDETWADCGFAVFACAGASAGAPSGVGAFFAAVGCLGAVRVCVRAAKATNKYEAERRERESVEAADKAAAGGTGSSGSGGGGESTIGNPSSGGAPSATGPVGGSGGHSSGGSISVWIGGPSGGPSGSGGVGFP